jgi:hypothetical protein
VRSTGGESVLGNNTVGADPVLRFLALLEPSPRSESAAPGAPGTPPGANKARRDAAARARTLARNEASAANPAPARRVRA